MELRSGAHRIIVAVLLALDVHYRPVTVAGRGTGIRRERAKAVGLSFGDWAAAEAIAIEHVWVEDVAAYRPGRFFERELPCLLAVLARFDLAPFRAIVVDGYVHLDEDGRAGLGQRLYTALGEQTPVVGVAKRAFARTGSAAVPLLRGASATPLYVSAAGMPLPEAAAHVATMHGAYRTPTLLRLLDHHTKYDSDGPPLPEVD